MNNRTFNQLFEFNKESITNKVIATPQKNKKPKQLHKKPSMYKVVLLNDDQTPMDFVTMTLKLFFNKGDKEALEITRQTHENGEGVCGTFTRDVAETKLGQVIDFARANGHPLKCMLNRDA